MQDLLDTNRCDGCSAAACLQDVKCAGVTLAAGSIQIESDCTLGHRQHSVHRGLIGVHASELL
jgi:hypothetical protein